jgi:hypothetical protein
VPAVQIAGRDSTGSNVALVSSDWPYVVTVANLSGGEKTSALFPLPTPRAFGHVFIFPVANSAVSDEAGHAFHRKPATDSDLKPAGIPI